MAAENLNPKQSLEVIEAMISKTNRRINTTGATQFLLWGYVTVLTSLLHYSLMPYMTSIHHAYIWLLIPFVGGIISWLMARRKRHQPYSSSQIDYFINTVWLVSGLNALACSFVLGFFTLIAIIILLGSASAITGFVLRIRVLQVCSILGMSIGYGSIILDRTLDLLSYRDYSLVFGVVFFVMHCIPGHYLYAQIRRELKSTPNASAI